jgi:DNA-binding response OmpR family regulator
MSDIDLILLAENDEAYATLVKAAFKRAHVHNPIEVVESERETIAYLNGEGRFANRTRYPLLGLIVLALPLPLFNDFRLLRWIRGHSEFGMIPVFVLSGVFIQGEDRLAHELGSDCYAEKPGCFWGLVEIVERIQDRWLEPVAHR